MKRIFTRFFCLAMTSSLWLTEVNAQTGIELSLATDYQNVINKAQGTYMRPLDGAANQKIHQWETSDGAAGEFSSYQWELRPATEEGYYYFINKGTGLMHKPTGSSNGESSLDGSFTLDESNMNDPYFMYAIEPVVSGDGTVDEGYYWIKNKGNGYYVRPNAGGGAPAGGSRNDVQLRHQSATTPIDGPLSYRWSFKPRTEAGVLSPHVWDGANWSKLVPPRYNNVAINGDYSLSSHGSFESNDLKVGAGATLTVESGQTLIVHGDLTNEGSVVVQSGGSLITKGAVSGTGYTIIRQTTYTTGRYSAVGSPVAEASTDALGSLIYAYDESLAYGSGGTERFVKVTSGESIQPGDAYFSAFTGEVTFTGLPNSGTIDVGLQYDANDGANAGFNLVSNPYPSALDFEKLVAENEDISGTIYLWDDGGSDTGQRGLSDYITVNSIGEVDNGSGRSGDWNGYIGTAQGFFVKAMSAGTLRFTDAMRVSGHNENASFFRVQDESPSTDIQSVRLGLTHTATQLSNHTLIGFLADATMGYDRLYDAHKMDGNNGLKLFSLLDNVPMAIQGLPVAGSGMTVPLGFSVAEAGEYDLSLVGLQNWPEDLQIYLEDLETGEIVELSATANYTFHVGDLERTNRFQLILATGRVLSVVDELEDSALDVRVSLSGLQLTSLDNHIQAEVSILNLSGRLLHHAQIDSSKGSTHVDYLFDHHQVYLIRIHSNRGDVVQKIVFE